VSAAVGAAHRDRSRPNEWATPLGLGLLEQRSAHPTVAMEVCLHTRMVEARKQPVGLLLGLNDDLNGVTFTGLAALAISRGGRLDRDGEE
jgi:hypothetical protein